MCRTGHTKEAQMSAPFAQRHTCTLHTLTYPCIGHGLEKDEEQAEETLNKSKLGTSNIHTHARKKRETDMQSYGNNKLNKICIKSIEVVLSSAQTKKKNEDEINKTSKKRTNLQLKITIKHRHEMCDAMRCDVM